MIAAFHAFWILLDRAAKFPTDGSGSFIMANLT
jgi:hypothetical protein